MHTVKHCTDQTRMLDTYRVFTLNLPFGVIMYILGGLNGNSLGKTSFPWYVPPETNRKTTFLPIEKTTTKQKSSKYK